MNLQISISRDQAEGLENLITNSTELTQGDFDEIAPVLEQLTQLLENDEWEE